MGGNAIAKAIKGKPYRQHERVIRLPLDLYAEVCDAVIGALGIRLRRIHELCLPDEDTDPASPKSLTFRLHPTRSYRSKETFGDLDILVSTTDARMRTWDPRTLGSCLLRVNEPYAEDLIARNGPVTSVGINPNWYGLSDDPHQWFQVDIVSTPLETFDHAKFYFDYNDLGNLMGRIAASMNLRLKPEGLFYVVRYDNASQGTDEVLLTTDPLESMDVLGLNPAAYDQGFDDPQDMFEFIVSSRNFNVTKCLPQNLSRKARVRDVKRAIYMAFVDYLGRSGIKSNPLWTPSETERLVASRFPNAFAEVGRIRYRRDRIAHFRERFNGKVVMKVTGLTPNDGPMIAAVLSDVRRFQSIVSGRQLTENEFMDIMLDDRQSSADMIEERIRFAYARVLQATH